MIRILDYAGNVERNRDAIRIIESIFKSNSSKLSCLMNFKSEAISNCVSNSYAEPMAISKNLEKSFEELRDAPSAIFEGIETAARRS